MEGIFFESLTVAFGVAFTGVVALIAIAAGLLLSFMAEEERAGARLHWAEWPIPATEIAPPVAERVRLAA